MMTERMTVPRPRWRRLTTPLQKVVGMQSTPHTLTARLTRWTAGWVLGVGWTAGLGLGLAWCVGAAATAQDEPGDAVEAGESGGADPTGVDDNRGGVTTGERIAFDQERAHANMRELEDRMFRLAAMIEAEEPDEAQRLRLGVEAARGAALADRMRETADLLAGMRTGFAQAAGEQASILEELAKLRALLLQADVDLELAIQRLEELQSAAENLEALTEAERAQREAPPFRYSPLVVPESNRERRISWS